MKDRPDGQKITQARAEAPKLHASAGPRGIAFRPPAYGIGALDVAQLQEDRGPTQQPAPESRGVIQRMRVDEIGKTFDDSDLWYYSNGLQPSAQVLKAISQLTTAWESMSKNSYHRVWRKKYIKAQISRTLAFYSGDDGAKAARVCQDVNYWKARLLVLFENGEDLFKPDVNKIVNQYSTLNQTTGIPPISKRILVEVTMGQGATGDLKKFIFHSDQFSSCSAVAMYNEESRVGGLFHYAANNQTQHQKLAEMAEEIEPTTIGMYVHTENDYDAIRDLFAPFEVERAEAISGHYFLYLTGKGKLVFGPQDPGEPAEFLNLTGMTNLPDEIVGQIPLSMYHEQGAYGAGFEVLPRHT